MTQEIFRGSCLCGAVQYEISGDPQRFYHCHCSRCRKASGTGHASNMIVKATSVKWIKGEELIKVYKVPEAKRFARHFCSLCGSSVPRYTPETGFVVIPAGSLDGEPASKPQGRIFWDSRVSWSCGDEDIPAYSEYPPA